MSVALSEAGRALLQSPALAHMVTIEPDGSPQVAIVWVGLDGDEIVSAHLDRRQRKVRNLERDPRVAVSIESDRTNAMGLREHMVVHGRARITEGGAPELLQELARVYLGPDVRFPPMDEPPPGVVVRVAIERVGGVGDWVIPG